MLTDIDHEHCCGWKIVWQFNELMARIEAYTPSSLHLAADYIEKSGEFEHTNDEVKFIHHFLEFIQTFAAQKEREIKMAPILYGC